MRVTAVMAMAASVAVGAVVPVSVHAALATVAENTNVSFGGGSEAVKPSVQVARTVPWAWNKQR